MSLFNYSASPIILHSGGRTNFLIDCNALTDEDLKALAYQFSRLHTWQSVWGIPRGGKRFAEALLQFNHPLGKWKELLVDDVCTTGQSFLDHQFTNPDDRHGVCIFDRSKGLRPYWVESIFVMQ